MMVIQYHDRANEWRWAEDSLYVERKMKETIIKQGRKRRK